MTSDTLARAQARRAKLQLLRADHRYKHVVGFLVAKGLMTATDITPAPSVKIPLADALWVGEVVEPRVLEVLPAALLHFPRSFLNRSTMPDDLTEALRCIQHGDADGPPFRGVPYERMMRWAAFPLRDKRTRLIKERRVARTFRISPALLAQITAYAARTKLTQTDVVEQALTQMLKMDTVSGA